MIRDAALIALAILTGCVIDDADVLVIGPVLHVCTDASGRISDEQACDFVDVCALPLVNAPPCCAELIACTAGSLAVHPYCSDGCVSCDGDRDCPRGEAFCGGTTCTACPEPGTCPSCPMSTVALTRNGCTTCDCGPASECDLDPGTGCEAMGMLQCYPGQRCAAGCQPGEPGCCLNVCALPGCASPAPLGCDTPCPPNLGCESCQATACRCDGMAWTCDAVCADTTGACFLPRS